MAEESGWTIETLREYILAVIEARNSAVDQRFWDMEKAVTAAMASSEKAILKAETATERRFESVNEFRQTLTDQANTFMTRSETVILVERNAERIRELTDRLNRTEGGRDDIDKDRAKLRQLVVISISAAVLILSIVVALANGVFK